MSGTLELTDNQWYNFICGMQAGLKLKDLTLPVFSTNVVLKPIGVGGHGKIGIAIPQVLWDGVSTSMTIPVYTHDVDIGYAGFSCRITWDTTRLHVSGLADGEFGGDGSIVYSIDNGVCLVRGLKEAPTEYKEPMVLFYLTVDILDLDITKDTPIHINLVDGSGHDPDYTTLLTYVLNDQDGEYYTYYITPIKNISGAIVTDKVPNKSDIGDGNEASAPSSPSGVFIGTSYTPPGKRGAVPITANSNVLDNFPYSAIRTRVVVDDTSVIFNYLDVVGVDGWSIETDITNDADGNLVLDIEGVREESKQDSVTVGYIDYEIGNKDGGYVIPLNNTLSQLIN